MPKQKTHDKIKSRKKVQSKDSSSKIVKKRAVAKAPLQSKTKGSNKTQSKSSPPIAVKKKVKTKLPPNKKKISAKKDKKRPSKELEYSFASEISNFIDQIESLDKAAPPTMETMSARIASSQKSLSKLIKSKRILSKEEDGTESFNLEPKDMPAFEKKIKILTTSLLAVRHIPRGFFLSLVSQYDAFLGRLIRVSCYVKPEHLSASGKTLTFSDLEEFSSLAKAKDALIAKEVESVLRESHIDHICWMEKRFNLELRKDPVLWSKFVELTERRNLFAHCDGLVTPQYIKICRENGVKFDSNIKVGSQLDVSEDYFRQSFNCLYEIGVKLGLILWRNLLPDELEKADDELHQIGFDLLSEERYELVKTMLAFAKSPSMKPAEDVRRYNLINLASAHKFSGNKKECDRLLKSEDWTACGDLYNLGVSILRNEYKNAAKLMKRIGTNTDLQQQQYSSWPIFKEFRKSKEFLETYRTLFGKKFVLQEDSSLIKTTS